ncbi:riboflavin synthase [Sporosalibacterium faouarense]|uniref:riboflavin synthase n=1 Tax=Sporosalibacterium faouarense TaxID=516123 RepID=UPI00141D5FD2|nr:riboflavin synthase [Sporosalibacterium faouarense]MTI48236.1 riboflavin synthase [Bacillota bacterium]
MFTGLIEEIGIIQSIKRGVNSAQISIKANEVLKDISVGDSISTNGVCLTVIYFNKNEFVVDVMPETMRRSNLKHLKNGNEVNLERALKVGDRFGGHIVSGHIDGMGTISEFKEEDNATWVTIKACEKIMKYIIEKGSIAIDGTSLTVAYVDLEKFKVSIIPLTKNETILLRKKIGEEVNIECDMVGKYIERISNFNNKEMNKSALDINFLKENGFA